MRPKCNNEWKRHPAWIPGGEVPTVFVWLATESFHGEDSARIKTDANLQEPNWDEVTEKQKLDVYKFRIDLKESDVQKHREVLSVIKYLAGYCCYVVFKKIKCNSCKDFISGRDNMEDVPEIKLFGGINRGSLFYPNDTNRNFVR